MGKRANPAGYSHLIARDVSSRKRLIARASLDELLRSPFSHFHSTIHSRRVMLHSTRISTLSILAV